jgi:hypothetical protein
VFGTNEDNYFRARPKSCTESQEAVNKELLEAKMIQRKGSIEAMRQRYMTLQKVSTDNNALFIAQKCPQYVASLDNTILAAQYRKMERFAGERAEKKATSKIQVRTPDIEKLRRRYNLDN